jgi:hypothetical protein
VERHFGSALWREVIFMSDAVLFVGWGDTHPGREKFARKHYAEFVEILTRLKEAGEIERFETVLLEPHGGDLDGFTLVHGAPEKLAVLEMRQDLHALRTRAMLDHGRFGVIPAVTGEAVERELALVAEGLEEYEREPVLVA